MMSKQMKQFLISTPNSPEKHSPAAEIVVGNVDLLTEMLLRVPALSAKENDIAVVVYNRGKVFSCYVECKTMKVLCELSPGEISDFTQVKELHKRSYQFIESLSPV